MTQNQVRTYAGVEGRQVTARISSGEAFISQEVTLHYVNGVLKTSVWPGDAALLSYPVPTSLMTLLASLQAARISARVELCPCLITIDVCAGLQGEAEDSQIRRCLELVQRFLAHVGRPLAGLPVTRGVA